MQVCGQKKEYQLDRDQYEDFSYSARISLGDLITRYRDEITPHGHYQKVVHTA